MQQDQKPGAGVDRTTIRALLQLTPAERLKRMVDETRNVQEFFAKLRFIQK
jgi:hypothetical protein